MFDTLLIANRGEIACRIIRTARALGLRTVAVHSDVDAGALHVAMADQAVSLGGAAPAESYLNGAAIIAAARATGTQAVHPGYGFLSENPEFAEACAQAGLIFVGPSAQAMRAMGLKDAAKATMEAAGVPVVPGYHGADQDAVVLAQAAHDIGYPVLIKAVAGGGGKGMRRVEAAADFAEALRAARAEAKGAFGNDAVLVEKYVAKPRHIEVQVFGDGTRAVHLFERDCSLQRRHQKVIEEAPAPGMTDAMRDAMGAAAVRAAEAIGYSGAGTVEFIVDASEGLRPDRFYFMEMNTRLQVEHPVSEEITGVDLVAWQLRIAAGEALPAQQDDLAITGHAFEARLYAEDVPAGFLPATGRLSHLAFPGDVRAETGVRAGDEISPWYDPMIAKVVVHGPTRAIALKRLQRGLAATQVAGTVTNLGFLSALAAHDGFVAGDVDTGLIDRDLERLSTAPPLSTSGRAWAAMVAAGLDAAPGPLTGFTLWTPLRRAVTLDIGGAAVTATLEVQPGAVEITIDTQTSAARWDGQGWQIDGQMPPAHARDGAQFTIFEGAGHSVTARDPLDRATAEVRDGRFIEAPMPGLVRAVHVAPGDSVAEGQALALLEAMKMEHVLRAERAGTVAEVRVSAGGRVAAGDLLIRLDSEGDEESRT